MAAKNTTRDADDWCPLDTALKFLGSVWAIRILWWLHLGPSRFGELRRQLGTVSAKVLTERLRKMERQGLVLRRKLPTIPEQVEYSLTPVGREFVPLLATLLRIAQTLRRRHGVQ